MGALGALLLGTGVTAFGVAPLAPDAADLPVRQITESVTPLSLDTLSTDALPALPFVLYRSDLTRREDTAQSLLSRLGVDDAALLAFLRTDPAARELLAGRAGKLVSVQTTEQQALVQLTARWLPANDARDFKRLSIVRNALGNLESRIELAPLQVSQRLASGTITSSLFAATDRANLPDSVAVQMAEIFSDDIDFRRDLRQNDRFSLVYETLEADGEILRSGRILSAEFVNNGRSLQTLWFQEEGQKGGYYGFDGQSRRRTYLASPLEFSRVSSGYGMRFHPVLGSQRAHLGIDYAAPTGTPVRTVGDGVVTFAGWQRGYGNFIVIQHRNKQETAFAHLSRIDVKRGQRVTQGEFIGAVGSTGMSTGPHLHFEFRENGKHLDPLTIARTGEAIPVSAAARPAFDAVAQAMRTQLAAAATVTQASAQ